MMSVLEESYENLKRMAIRRSFDENGVDIATLAKAYEHLIDSTRVLSCITDVQSLIKVLEKRGALNPMQTDALDFIFKALKLDLQLLTKHSDLIEIQCNADSARHQNRLIENNYPQCSIPVEQRVNNLGMNILPSDQSSVTSSGNNSRCGGTLSERVTDIVCTQIGYSWKNLARYLKVVQECTIDQIEEDDNLKTNEARARTMFCEFQRKMDDADIKPRLLKALRLSNRMDIHDQVQKQFLRESQSEFH